MQYIYESQEKGSSFVNCMKVRPKREVNQRLKQAVEDLNTLHVDRALKARRNNDRRQAAINKHKLTN